ncbi:uncharacterized protein LOC124293881 [Neodiprion lecontei]|uniref:Uncharacterized protein LOC124293881 n=1 Tax=Neodiprion lecontei TaxID=441921 RepID=A0ABM3FXB2_NEOLC|nr:uncharacterized protein LOC124216245 [Neodiprion pinetum]XP_046592649.1 uncharacterized protein LOC124293881 [Neodiprion lecontei]
MDGIVHQKCNCSLVLKVSSESASHSLRHVGLKNFRASRWKPGGPQPASRDRWIAADRFPIIGDLQPRSSPSLFSIPTHQELKEKNSSITIREDLRVRGNRAPHDAPLKHVTTKREG